MNTSFSLKYLGLLNYFLGIEVNNLKNGDLQFTQCKYKRELLQNVNMEDCKPIATSMLVNYIMLAHKGDVFHNPNFYGSIVGTFKYVTIIKPNTTFPLKRFVSS